MGFTERERFILHLSVLEMIKQFNNIPEPRFQEMLGRIAKERCRHLTHEDQEAIISDMGDEFLSSKSALSYIEDDIRKTVTGK